jgi:hypothetical protein
MKILLKFPSRERPQKLLEVYKKYISMAFDSSLIHGLITLDSNDYTVTPELIKDLEEVHSQTKVIVGISGSKIKAVNRDMDKAPEYDIILLASDDMIPQIMGYDHIIRQNMLSLYPDTDGVLWFNDGLQGSRLNTLCILGKTYYERFGYIYHPAYKSLYCDNEFMHVAARSNKQTYIDQVIIKHEHHLTGKTPLDPLYVINDSYDKEDCETYMKRIKLGFPV